MSEAFTSINIEVYINSAWVDLTPDVLYPRNGFFGINETTMMGRVADRGEFKFSLDNSELNSAGSIGYYSPEHANALSGWQSGLPVQVTYQYDGLTKYDRYYINPDGIQVDSGVYLNRRVHVTCSDWMGYAADHKMDLTTRQLTKRVDQAIPLVLANMPIQPQKTNLNTGASTFDTIFDISTTETTAMGEFQRLSVSEWGHITRRRDGYAGETLLFNNRANNNVVNLFPKYTGDSGLFLLNNGTDKLLLNDGTSFLILNETRTLSLSDSDWDANSPPKTSYGTQLYNRVKIITTPRKLDDAATTILWSMNNSVQVPAGGTVTPIRARYRDPNAGADYVNGTDMVDPVADTDYQAFQNADGSGGTLTSFLSPTVTFGAADAEITLVNTGGTALYTGGSVLFQLRGRGIYTYDKSERKIEDTDSINTFDVQELTIEWKYDSDLSNANLLANAIVNTEDFANPHTFVERVSLVANKSTKNMLAFMYIEPPFLITSLTDSMSGISGDQYMVLGMNYRIDEGDVVSYDLLVTKYFTVVDF